MISERDSIRAALSHVPARDRDTWVRMGMAVKAELGEDGFDIWDQWSQQDESYSERDAREMWRSIDANGKVTGGTLYYEAKRHGFSLAASERPSAPSAEEIAKRQRDTRAVEEREAKKREQAAARARDVWKAVSA